MLPWWKNGLLINPDIYGQLDEQAIVQAMYQTVREFFLRPHKSVIESHFQNRVRAQPALKMIAITCIKCLGFHLRELENKFHSAVDARVSAWDSKDIIGLVQYLDNRPLIKYSLEYLTQLKKDLNVDPDIQKPFSDLATDIQNCPSSLQICLLERLTNLRSDTQRMHVQELNRLLGIAAEGGYIIAVGNLLAAGAECNTAARGRHQEADLSVENGHWPTPLHLNAQKKHQMGGRLVIEKSADVLAANQDRRTPLHFAAQNGHAAVARLLIEKGADISVTNQDRRTPLHIAALNVHEAVAWLLIDKGANVLSANQGERTPLHFAAQDGQEKIARLLIEKGAGISAQNQDGQTPLHSAAENGHETVARLLIGKGADVAAANKYGRTPLLSVAWKGHETVRRLRIVKGPASQLQIKLTNTAVQIGKQSLARLLIQMGADVSAADQDGQTPLHFAVQNGQEAVARLLIEKGADVAATNQYGRTPLLFAALSVHGTAQLPIENSAGFSVANQDGLTRLLSVTWKGHEMVRQLCIVKGPASQLQ